MLVFNIIFISGIENQNARSHSRNATSYYQQHLTEKKAETYPGSKEVWAMRPIQPSFSEAEL